MLHPLFADHAVLQRDSRVPVWGWAEPGATSVPIRTDDCPGLTKPADPQVIYPPTAMPIVDMHTHMDAKTQYAEAVEAMDQWTPHVFRQELAGNKSIEAAAAKKKLDDFLNSINTKTLDRRSAADVVNEGKRLIFEIVKAVYRNRG